MLWLVVGLIMTATMTMGQLYRQRHGPAGIGLESIAILGVYGLAIVTQTALAGGG